MSSHDPTTNQAQDAEGHANAGLLSLWRSLRKHWITAFAVAIVVIVGVTFWTTSQKRIYEASASIQFDPNPPRPLGGKVESVVEMGSGAVWDAREYYETQYQIMRSRRVALNVVRQLGLDHDARFVQNAPPGGHVQDLAEPIPEEDAAELLRARLRIDPVKNSRMAVMRVQDADPERAATLARALAESYRDQNIDTVLESTKDASEWLRSEHDALLKELETSELALHKYKEDKNILSVQYDDQSNMLREEIGQLNQALTTVRTRREEVAARAGELGKVKADNPAELPSSELLSNPLLQALRQDYINALREEQALLKSGLGRNNPEVQSASARVDESRKGLLDEVKNVQAAVQRDLAIVSRQEGGISGLFERAKKQGLELNLLEIEYNRLRRAKDNTEKLYSLLLERSKESDLTRRLRVNNVSIVDAPVVPKAPIKPNLPLNVGGGIVIGLVLGALAAVGRGMLDRTVKTPSDIEQTLRATFLGLIPEIDDRSAGPRLGGRKRGQAQQQGAPELIMHENPMSGVAEASRSVRTNLMFMAPDKPYRTLLVTSAGPSEGKTTIACCIATAMAQAGKRVLLIDCDLGRPRVHRIFRRGGRDMGPGLTTALLEEGVEEQLPVETEVPNLWVVPAGPIPPNPSELLHSERFRALLGRMNERFDQVILDSPPLVAVTDATILSTIVDGTVMVVRAFKTRKDLAEHGLRLLSDVGANLAGVVLNAVNLSKDEYKYSYYYYYRRGNYYANPAEGGSAAPGAPDNESRPSA